MFAGVTKELARDAADKLVITALEECCDYAGKRGVFLGSITRVSGESVALTLSAPLKPGDGVVFDSGNPAEGEEGGRVYQVEPSRSTAGETVLRFGHGDINGPRVRAGQRGRALMIAP